MVATQHKPNLPTREVSHHGSEGCYTNDGLSSTRALRGSSDLGGILKAGSQYMLEQLLRPEVHTKT